MERVSAEPTRGLASGHNPVSRGRSGQHSQAHQALGALTVLSRHRVALAAIAALDSWGRISRAVQRRGTRGSARSAVECSPRLTGRWPLLLSDVAFTPRVGICTRSAPGCALLIVTFLWTGLFSRGSAWVHWRFVLSSPPSRSGLRRELPYGPLLSAGNLAVYLTVTAACALCTYRPLGRSARCALATRLVRSPVDGISTSEPSFCPLDLLCRAQLAWRDRPSSEVS
ncbi:hypothetical protein TREES_T100014127 [Tupaia chinensis]|uniref:Uncharacterized protein n=1 Tax=Tupaia chinensis TaxID=246437 RepID=L9KKK3_TUPCH|nr:hypothetical protein TREES_T100014127 [Tupaia chinensis]